MGVIQAAALRSGDTRWIFPPFRSRRVGLVLTGVWIMGAFACFWLGTPELLTPGPAGTELAALFALAALAAVGVTRGLARQVTADDWWPTTDDRRPTTDDGRPTTDNRPLTQYAVRTIFYVLLSLLVAVCDVPLFRLLNGLAGRSAVLDATVQFLMNDYIVPTALVLTLLGLWFAGASGDERAANQATVLRALLAMLLANAILKFINGLYFRPRPFTYDEVTLLFYHPSDSSFPSNAATVGFSLAMAVWLRRRRWGAWMLMLAGAMSLARVCGGVHYPLDVVAGAWLGAAAAYGVSRIAWLDKPLAVVMGWANRLGLA